MTNKNSNQMKKTIAIILCSFLLSNVYAQDILLLKTGEKIPGTMQSMNNGMISFQAKGNLMKFKTNEVTSITFSNRDDNAAGSVSKVPGEKQIMSGSYSV